jgi:hypothetical protein
LRHFFFFFLRSSSLLRVRVSSLNFNYATGECERGGDDLSDPTGRHAKPAASTRNRIQPVVESWWN